MQTHSHTTDPSAVPAAVRVFLLAQPVDHQLILSILAQWTDQGTAGDLWWSTGRDGAVLGSAIQAPTQMPLQASRMTSKVARELAEAVYIERPDAPGVQADAATAASFAGRWTELSGGGAAPVEGQRIYSASTVNSPASTATMRQATEADVDLVSTWHRSFAHDIDAPPADDPVEFAKHVITNRIVSLAEVDGRPVSIALATTPSNGLSRVGHVYTPPEHRSNGYGAAIVAWLTQQCFDQGASQCLLYTQLANPTSNSVYRSIGYVAHSEVLRYEFIPRTTLSEC